MTVPSALSDADFDAIASTVRETERGRWFLAEYARRNRRVDTQTLLAAIDRLEGATAPGRVRSVPGEDVRSGLTDMADAIARTKEEIAALRSDTQYCAFDDATEELDGIVGATEKAASDILLAAEQIQETAWSLREQGASADACDQLDARATDVYTASSFQDLTGQRIRKVISVLRYLESRINSMIAIWSVEARHAPLPMSSSDALANGPAKPGEGIDQAGADMIMRTSEDRTASEPEIAVADASSEKAPISVRDLAATEPHSEAVPQRSSVLNSLASMSYEERIALFT